MNEKPTHAVPESKPTPWLGIGVVVVIALIGFYIVKTNKQNELKLAQSQTTAQEQTVPTKASLEGAGVAAGANDSKAKVFTITAANFSFTPNVMKVKKGDTVKIILDNKEGFHDFVIDEFKAKTKSVKANETDTIEFVADKAGSFEYYCSIGTHRQMGMKGTLTVE